jgi:hypothetical protein
MNIKTLSRCFAAAVLFFHTFPAVCDESFRVREVSMMTLERDGTAQLGISEALAISLPRNREFLKGITLDIDIPIELVSFSGAVAYSFYTAVTPAPSREIIDYTGKRLTLEALPPRTGLSLGIPYGSSGALKPSPYMQIVPFTLTADTDIVFFRIQLVMKGVPEQVLVARLNIIVKPVFEDKGKLSLAIVYPRDANNVIIEKPFTIFIDEHAVDIPSGAIVLESGLHHLSIVSDYYRNETRVITIAKAQTVQLEIALTDIAPLLTLTAPEGAEILLDGKKIEHPTTNFPITPGEHTLRFSLGGYEIVKTIHAANGKTYSVVLGFDIEITETQ